MPSHSPAQASRPGGFATLVRSIAPFLVHFRRRRRTLVSLEQLDDRLLRDVGLSRWDVTVMRRHW
jgi:uncharacterized protein YjiS (DUF1127 family)